MDTIFVLFCVGCVTVVSAVSNFKLTDCSKSIYCLAFMQSIKVKECLARDRGIASSSLAGGTAFCPSARHFILCFVLVQPRKTCSNMTENC